MDNEIPDNITPEERKIYNEWKATQGIPPDPVEPVERLNKFVQSELSNRTPVTMPREYMWAAGAAGIVLILTAWPVLILGMVLGAFGMYKVGCPCNKERK